MAFDLLFQHETDADWSRSPEARGASVRRRALPLDFTAIERKALKTLEPSTAAFVVDLLGWARGQGIPARLSHTTVYTPEDSERYYKGGGSSIKPGRLDWHNVGRAFHLVIPNLPNGETNRDAYAAIGQYARQQGGEWLGDKPFRNVKGQIIYDTAHYEYHPGVDLKTYRTSDLAQKEFAQAQRRARMYT